MDKVKCVVKLIDRNAEFRKKLLNGEYDLVSEIKNLKWKTSKSIKFYFLFFKNYLKVMYIFYVIIGIQKIDFFYFLLKSYGEIKYHFKI